MKKSLTFLVGLLALCAIAIAFDEAPAQQVQTSNVTQCTQLSDASSQCAGLAIASTITATTTPVNVSGVSRLLFSCGAACTVTTWSNVIPAKLYTICTSTSNMTIDRTATFTIGGVNYNPTAASGETCSIFLGLTSNQMRQITTGQNSL